MSDDSTLGDRVIAWMIENKPRLDELMAQEGSKAVHEEFILAEGGTMPGRDERVERARGASARAWLRHLAHAVGSEWEDAPDGLGDAIEAWLVVNQERLEAIRIDEEPQLERLGRSGDPEADERRLALAAQRRFFAEAVGASASIEGRDGPTFGREISAWGWAENARLRELQLEALTASGIEVEATTEIELLWERSPETARQSEAAVQWANLRFLIEGLEVALAA